MSTGGTSWQAHACHTVVVPAAAMMTAVHGTHTCMLQFPAAVSRVSVHLSQAKADQLKVVLYSTGRSLINLIY